MQTTIMVAIFPIYFVKVAGAGLPEGGATQRLATINSVALVVIALVSPVLGAVADYGGTKKRFLAAFMLVGVIAMAGMWFVHTRRPCARGWLFVLVARRRRRQLRVLRGAAAAHRPAGGDRPGLHRGYALGYVGGGHPAGAQPGTGSRSRRWFGLPAGPGLSRARRPSRSGSRSSAWRCGGCCSRSRSSGGCPSRRPGSRRTSAGRQNPIRVAFVRLGETFRELRGYRQAFLLLLAFLIYNDGIQTIIKMATAYGTELGIGQSSLIGAILLVQFVGIPFSFLFGMLAERIGAKRAMFVGLVVYTVISILGYYMPTSTHFFVLAVLVGMVQGGTQALSRSLFASMIPPHKSAEFFGFFSVFEKFAGIFGPLFFAGTIAATGSSRIAILSVIGFFAVGGAILALVDVEEGRRAPVADRAQGRATCRGGTPYLA